MASYVVTFHFAQRGPFELQHCLTIEAKGLWEAACKGLGDAFAWSGDAFAQRVTVERFDEQWELVERGSWLVIPGNWPKPTETGSSTA